MQINRQMFRVPQKQKPFARYINKIVRDEAIKINGTDGQDYPLYIVAAAVKQTLDNVKTDIPADVQAAADRIYDDLYTNSVAQISDNILNKISSTIDNLEHISKDLPPLLGTLRGLSADFATMESFYRDQAQTTDTRITRIRFAPQTDSELKNAEKGLRFVFDGLDIKESNDPLMKHYLETTIDELEAASNEFKNVATQCANAGYLLHMIAESADKIANPSREWPSH